MTAKLSKIHLLSGVPLTPDYHNTILFDTEQAQISYFLSKALVNLSNYSYQRHTKNSIRVGISADKMYNVNYMCFQNTAFGQKWFYAFVTDVEYVNDNTSDVFYELDVMQTYIFDTDLEMCFVERQHAESDGVGENITPEPVHPGEYVFQKYGRLPGTAVLDPLAVFVAISDESEAPDGRTYGGVYGGTTLYAFNADDTETIKSFLDQYASRPDAVVSVYMAPVIATGSAIESGKVTKIAGSSASVRLTITDVAPSDVSQVDGYNPQNKKLLTYPFNFYSVTAGSSSATFRYEFFAENTPTFYIDVPETQPVQVTLRPVNYKGSGEQRFSNERVVLDSWPMCSWNTDAFKAWLAQNTAPIASSVGMLGAGALGMALTGGAVGGNAVGSALSSTADLVRQGYQASISADITKGNIASGSVDVASGTKNFFGGQCCVKAQQAKVIDDFFSMFGYAQNRLMVPNRKARPHWTYLKTVGCNLTGTIPAFAMQKLISIYDNGLTFWRKPEEVGNYSLNNKPVEG